MHASSTSRTATGSSPRQARWQEASHSLTHSVQAASHAERVLFLKDGKFCRRLRRGEHSREELFRAISRTLETMATRNPGDARA